MMRKRFMLLACAVSLLVLGSNAYASPKPIDIIVKGNVLHSDAAPIVENGRVLVPVRVITEALDAGVVWDAKQQTVSVSKYTEKVNLTIGQKKAQVTGLLYDYEIPLDASVMLEDGRVYIPLRLLSQTFGYKVAWKDGAVSISSPLDEAQRSTLYQGDLLHARKLVMSMMWKQVYFTHKPLITTHAHEDYSSSFIFPEGKALKFYMIDSNETVSLVEVKDDFPVVTWQAHVDIDTAGDGITKLVANELFDQTGPKPSIGTKFAFYTHGMAGDSNDASSGSIDADGKITTLAYILKIGGEVTNAKGTVSLTLPHEVRDE
ncbi:stalk domain-containing protein [Paenibacillus albus]|uniref:Copper amine oxidase N-terminal domain-containing protein n=1 Tax=Paenibacillus albus TaxID=2495582 RepID=A0A3S8ZXT0_9BACL|nr:stalk domain-containing protein [Paenibacillus albus]AZN38307.1 copper amine oxidase N-terminal domain-containing protein [Paenibacillus albus]